MFNTLRLSPKEYLTLERGSEVRHEYRAGEVVEITAESQEHSLICGNVRGELHQQLRGRPCEVHGGNMRIKIPSSGWYTYPDAFVVCPEIEFEDCERDTLLNPVMIGEVLSPATEASDRGEKFMNYRRIEKLQEFVLISQDQVRVERFVRQGRHWLLREFAKLEDSLRLDSIGCELPLRTIYESIDFVPRADLIV